MKYQIVPALLVAWLVASPASAQPIYTGDGWEAFPAIRYEGGDATQPKTRKGMLVLTDSTLALHPCVDSQSCTDRYRDKKTKLVFREPPFFVIQLASLTQISSSSQVIGPGAADRFFRGVFATDQSDGFIGLVYETATGVEAPLFKTQKSQAAAIEAKVRFRLKKLGIDLATQTP